MENKVSTFDKIIDKELNDSEKDSLETVNQIHVKRYAPVSKNMKKNMKVYLHTQK
jgi:hypothetical protein